MLKLWLFLVLLAYCALSSVIVLKSGAGFDSKIISAVILVLYGAYLCKKIHQWQRARQAPDLQISDYLIVYASETGTSLHYAQQTKQRLQQQGLSCLCINANQLNLKNLHSKQKILFMLSTSGDGEPPTNAKSLLDALSIKTKPLSYALIGFGDSHYQHFCGFAKQVSAKLKQQGFHAIQEDIFVDRESPSALKDWFSRITKSSYYEDNMLDLELKSRHLLNPESRKNGLYQLQLESSSELTFKPGDLLYINISQQQRCYSIASAPDSNTIELIIREHIKPDGSPGVGSNFFCKKLEPGEKLAARISANPNFRLPDKAINRPKLFIATGAGISGVLGHLQQQSRLKQGGHWLVFGESSPEHDNYIDLLCQKLLTDGTLTRLDTAYSQAQDNACYVQDVLIKKRTFIDELLEQEGYIMICGSEHTGKYILATLEQLLGADTVRHLQEQERLKTDIYDE